MATDSTGLSQAQVASIAFGASARLGLDAGFAGASVHANAGKAYQSSLTDDERKVLSAMSSELLAEFKQFGDKVSRDASVMSAITSDSRDARDMASRLAFATTRSERTPKPASLTEGASPSACSPPTRGARRSQSTLRRTPTIWRCSCGTRSSMAVWRYGGDSAAVHTLMRSELARQTLRPNRVFSDGTALPTSFGELRAQHDQARDDVALTQDVSALHRDNDGRVSHLPTTVPTVKTAPPALPIRDEVRTPGAQIRSRAESSSAGFDSKAEIVGTDDGTLATKKSLLKQAGKQVARDAGTSVDNARDVVKDLLKKK